jgi:hypothetical protein
MGLASLASILSILGEIVNEKRTEDGRPKSEEKKCSDP